MRSGRIPWPVWGQAPEVRVGNGGCAISFASDVALIRYPDGAHHSAAKGAVPMMWTDGAGAQPIDPVVHAAHRSEQQH